MIIGFLVAIIFCSFFEWTLHRYVMHKPLWKFVYPFKSHTLIHHKIFKSDYTYHLIKEEDKHTIPMAWWNGPALILIGQIPFILISLLIGSWWWLFGTVIACSLYFSIYEYIHWCMHFPRKHIIERIGLFFRLNGHHLLHHRYMNKNFNVVMPLADLCFGTLLLRSPLKFAQATGISVPNVQPK